MATHPHDGVRSRGDRSAHDDDEAGAQAARSVARRAVRGTARVHRDRRARPDGRQPRTQPVDDHRRCRHQGTDRRAVRRGRASVPGDELGDARRRSQPEGDRVGRVPRGPSRRGAGAGDLDAARPSAARTVACKAVRRRTTARCCPACGASSWRRAPGGSGRHGRPSTSSTRRRSPNCSASPTRSPRSVCSPSATTPATRSRRPRRSAAEVTYLNRWKQPVT